MRRVAGQTGGLKAGSGPKNREKSAPENGGSSPLVTCDIFVYPHRDRGFCTNPKTVTAWADRSMADDELSLDEAVVRDVGVSADAEIRQAFRIAGTRTGRFSVQHPNTEGLRRSFEERAAGTTAPLGSRVRVALLEQQRDYWKARFEEEVRHHANRIKMPESLRDLYISAAEYEAPR